MTNAMLEHVNLTVSDPKQTAAMMEKLFGWKIRWQGPALNGGYTVHVGTQDSYLAVYSVGTPVDPTVSSYEFKGGLNHVGIVVDDMDATEAKVVAAGYTPENHGNYEPGRRFYFYDHDGIEFEVISYADPK